MSALLEAALRYASALWRVFPVGDASKVPITPRGHLDATIDHATITAWWAEHPDARIGVHLRASGLIAIDVDHYKPGATAALAALEAEHGPLPRDLNQRSGNGGEHIVMRDPSPGQTGWTRTQATGGRCRGLLAPGIDVKCNGYIIVEPSPSYRWISTRMPAPVPAAWLPLLQKSDDELGDGPGIEAWAQNVAAIAPDEVEHLRVSLRALGPRGAGRNTTMVAVARIFHDYGRGTDEGLPLLVEWNAQNGKPHMNAELCRQLERIAAKKLDGMRGHSLRSVQATIDQSFEQLKPQPVPGSFEALHAQALADVQQALGTLTNAPVKIEPLFEPAGVFMERKFPSVPWIVRPLFKQKGTGVLGGPPKAGKSWLLTEVARAAATGMAAFGHFTTGEPKRVAYFYAEDDGGDVQAHINALGKGCGMSPAQWKLLHANLYIESTGRILDVLRPADLAVIVASCRLLGKIDVLCLEPLRDIHSGKEDTSDDMAKVMRNLKLIGTLLGCTVLTAHHNNKHGEGTGGAKLRGSGAIYGSIDSGLFLTPDETASSKTRYINDVESKVKGLRSADDFRLTLEITDGPDDRSAIATWKYESVAATTQSNPIGPTELDEANRFVTIVREKAAAGVFFTPRAWEENSGLGPQATRRAWSRVGPAGDKRLDIATHHPIEHRRASGKGGGFVVPQNYQAPGSSATVIPFPRPASHG